MCVCDGELSAGVHIGVDRARARLAIDVVARTAKVPTGDASEHLKLVKEQE